LPTCGSSAAPPSFSSRALPPRPVPIKSTPFASMASACLSVSFGSSAISVTPRPPPESVFISSMPKTSSRPPEDRHATRVASGTTGIGASGAAPSSMVMNDLPAFTRLTMSPTFAMKPKPLLDASSNA
jgi:hypothetical protein